MEKEISVSKNEIQKICEELNDHKFFGLFINKVVNISSEKLKLKIFEILKHLNSSNISLTHLNSLIFEGLPDDIPSLRSLVWKLLLGLLPNDVNKWEDTLDQQRIEYNKLKKSYIEKLELDKIKKSEKISKYKSDSSEKPKARKIISDHPLATTTNSKWKSYFDDLELLEDIEKDVRRTRTHMHFFFMPAKHNLNIISNDEITTSADRKRNEPGKEDKKTFETNADVMTRILFVYGKKYPNIRYVQGMNEILAPIYYCFSLDQNPYFFMNLEADCFLCFENFMNDIKDIFIRSLDNTPTGIQTKIKRLSDLLKIVDRDMYNHFNDYKLEIQFFVFRWLTLFFTQEFEMPDILRLWDSLLAEDDKFEFMNFLCLAIMKMKRVDLIQGDFSEMMLCVQNLEKLDIERLIKLAVNIATDNSIKLD